MLQRLKTWQQGSLTRWKRAMDHEISGRPTITISNLWFNQSGMSSETCPACCTGARLSHQPLVSQETNAGQHQQLLPESTKSLSMLKSVAGSISRGIAQGEPPSTHLHPISTSRAGHCLNQSEGEAPGSCSWGVMEGSSLNSQTW